MRTTLNRALSVLVLIVALTAPALADVFSFSYSGVDVFSSLPASGSGLFTAEFDSPGVYTITGISGSATFGSTLYPITGLYSVVGNLFVPPSPGYFTDDPSNPDPPGSVSFLLSNGDLEVFRNQIIGIPGAGWGIIIYEFTPGPQPGQYEFAEVVGFPQAGGIQITDITSPVPEPTTLILLGTGLVGVATAARRRLIV